MKVFTVRAKLLLKPKVQIQNLEMFLDTCIWGRAGGEVLHNVKSEYSTHWLLLATQRNDTEPQSQRRDIA